MPKAIYVHIPFCEHICHYCDFNKFFLKGQPVDEYVDALLTEMEYVSKKFPAEEIKTIYIGGGTPTALNVKQLERIVKGLNVFFAKNQPVSEWTVEVNPGGVTKEQLHVLMENGVNRLSIGAQTFSNDLLKSIGRTHQAEDVFRTIQLARQIGFHNISVDLMFGLPHETIESFNQSLKQAFTLGVEHFSAYSLKIEEKTVFHNDMRKGKLELPPENIEVEMYKKLMREMDSHGYVQYEISNFAKEGYESQHNLTYWNNEEYYGLGAGAHGYVKGYRYANIAPVNQYISSMKKKKDVILEKHSVTEREKMEEHMFLGLRKLSGVSINAFYNQFQKDVTSVYKNEINDLVEKGLLIMKDDCIFLSREALFIANVVFEKFLFND